MRNGSGDLVSRTREHVEIGQTTMPVDLGLVTSSWNAFTQLLKSGHLVFRVPDTYLQKPCLHSPPSKKSFAFV